MDNNIFKAINPDWLPRADLVRFGPSSDESVEACSGSNTGEFIAQLGAEGKLTDHQASICTAFLHGYSLNKRLWGHFPVEHAKDVEWMSNSFDRLILAPQPKKAIMALVRSFIDTPPSTLIPDLMRGKGLGMIFLLHGPPGVGKTLTAGMY